MNRGNTLFSYQQLMQELKKLCADKRTGTMFITTDDNHSARFALQKGRIVACAYTLKKGYDALPLIQQIKSGAFAFADGVFSGMDELPLPETEVMFEVLGGSADGGNRAAGGARQAGNETGSGASFIDMNAAIKDIELELAVYVGPIADIICEEHFEEAGEISDVSDVVRLVETIASEIDDPAKEDLFKQRVVAKLKSAYGI